jgi:predicted nucleic acid-binding Zn finger protein
MSDLETLGLELDAEYEMDELDSDQRRTARAVTEKMLVVPEYTRAGYATGMYRVYSQSQRQYTVSLPDGACDCPNMIHNAPESGCKHLRRVRALANHDTNRFPATDEPVAGYAEELRELLTAIDDRCAVLQAAAEVENVSAPTDDPKGRAEEYRTFDWLRSALREESLLDDC